MVRRQCSWYNDEQQRACSLALQPTVHAEQPDGCLSLELSSPPALPDSCMQHVLDVPDSDSECIVPYSESQCNFLQQLFRVGMQATQHRALAACAAAGSSDLHHLSMFCQACSMVDGSNKAEDLSESFGAVDFALAGVAKHRFADSRQSNFGNFGSSRRVEYTEELTEEKSIASLSHSVETSRQEEQTWRTQQLWRIKVRRLISRLQPRRPEESASTGSDTQSYYSDEFKAASLPTGEETVKRPYPFADVAHEFEEQYDRAPPSILPPWLADRAKVQCLRWLKPTTEAGQKQLGCQLCMYIKLHKTRNRRCWYADAEAWLSTLCERWEILTNTAREHCLGYLLQGRPRLVQQGNGDLPDPREYVASLHPHFRQVVLKQFRIPQDCLPKFGKIEGKAFEKAKDLKKEQGAVATGAARSSREMQPPPLRKKKDTAALTKQKETIHPLAEQVGHLAEQLKDVAAKVGSTTAGKHSSSESGAKQRETHEVERVDSAVPAAAKAYPRTAAKDYAH
eukprot:542860-Amphidinium_carterae.2